MATIGFLESVRPKFANFNVYAQSSRFPLSLGFHKKPEAAEFSVQFQTLGVKFRFWNVWKFLTKPFDEIWRKDSFQNDCNEYRRGWLKTANGECVAWSSRHRYVMALQHAYGFAYDYRKFWTRRMQRSLRGNRSNETYCFRLQELLKMRGKSLS